MDTRTTAERLAFDTTKHVLGSLCLRGHDAGGSQSWRHIKPRGGPGGCVTCTRERAASWKAENPERSQASTRRRDATRTTANRRKAWPFALHLSSIRRRSAQKGIPCRLTVDQLKILWRDQDGRCFWTGRSLSFMTGGDRHPLRPSLDRLDPAAGYVPDNVVWSSNFANRARGELDAAEFAEMMTEMGFSGMFRDRY